MRVVYFGMLSFLAAIGIIELLILMLRLALRPKGVIYTVIPTTSESQYTEFMVRSTKLQLCHLYGKAACGIILLNKDNDARHSMICEKLVRDENLLYATSDDELLEVINTPY